MRTKKTTKILRKFSFSVWQDNRLIINKKTFLSFLNFLIPSKSLTFASVNTPFYPLS